MLVGVNEIDQIRVLQSEVHMSPDRRQKLLRPSQLFLHWEKSSYWPESDRSILRQNSFSSLCPWNLKTSYLLLKDNEVTDRIRVINIPIQKGRKEMSHQPKAVSKSNLANAIVLRPRNSPLWFIALPSALVAPPLESFFLFYESSLCLLLSSSISLFPS